MRFALIATFLVPAIAVAQGTKEDYDRAGKLAEVRRGTVVQEVEAVTWLAGGATLRYRTERVGGKREWVQVECENSKRTVVPEPKAAPEAKQPRREPEPEKPKSPFRLEIRDHNVVIVDGMTEHKLTADGTAADPYTSRHWWSPDFAKLVVHRRTRGGDRRVTLVESSPKDQLQPKTSSYFYLKPGDEIPQPRPVLFNIATKKRIDVKTDLFADPWDISYEQWSPDGKFFFFLYNQRGHQVMRLIRIDASTGEAKAVIVEEPKTFVDYSQKTYLKYLPKANEAIWMSERSGFNHLYRIDLATGTVKNPITSGDWLVRSVVSTNEESGELTLRILGHDPKQSPYHVHYARVKSDGTNFRVLTRGDGTHRLDVSPDGKFAVDIWSRVDLPPVAELLDLAKNTTVTTLETADAARLAKTGCVTPERFVAPGRDGVTPIHGVIYRPTNFDKSKTYKVIEYIYAGPHDHFAPVAFRPLHNSIEPMAELGFIVVTIDGMGTNWRSKAFHDVCWKNLGDSGFADRIPWIKAAAKRHPEMDLAGGVGIFGGSAGGQSSTRAVLAHGEFYKVAVSDCGCHDNRMDKIWWNEAWMGKVGPHYAEQSNVTNADRLTGKLMLVVGELDRNVDPASTFQLANALIRANKDFDFLIMPGVGHGAAETAYASRRRADFFVRHLTGVEPRR